MSGIQIDSWKTLASRGGSCFIQPLSWGRCQRGKWLFISSLCFFLCFSPPLKNVIAFFCLVQSFSDGGGGNWKLQWRLVSCGEAACRPLHTVRGEESHSSAAVVLSSVLVWLCAFWLPPLTPPPHPPRQATCWTCWSGEPTLTGSTTASPSSRRSTAQRSSRSVRNCLPSSVWGLVLKKCDF